MYTTYHSSSAASEPGVWPFATKRLDAHDLNNN